CGSATSNKYGADILKDWANKKNEGHYGMNENCSNKADGSYQNPSSCAFFADAGEAHADAVRLGGIGTDGKGANPKAGTTTTASGIHARHSDNVNFCFADGHCGALKRTGVPQYVNADSKLWVPGYTGTAD
ncbi:MAG: hypothetical protein IKS20_09605, partial [Victivallales bacterium]|nr:hypothetical protein [Victivallales bacterium]